jgi:YegS/Rv2252/BmrU family lipid kinase
VKVRAILNPRAGLAAHKALTAAARRRPSWGEIDVRITTAAGEARELARQAIDAGCDLLLAIGGDGTVNEVAWGMLGSETLLGVVPVGSGNGLARTLGIPLDPERALAVLESGVARRMDVGMANERPFLNVAGAGFDAAVGAEFHARGARGGRRGILAYVMVGLAKSLSYRAPLFRLEWDGQQVETKAFVVAFVNGRQYGGGAVIAPGARLDDGRLEIVIIEEASLPEVLLNAPRLFTGTIERFRRYRRLDANGAALVGVAPLEHHRDGEPEAGAGTDRLEVTVRHRALRILVPRATAEDPRGPFQSDGS